MKINGIQKKVRSAILSLVLITIILALSQSVLIPKFMMSSTTMIDGIYNKQNKDIDYLFIGSSQMYCTVDAEMMYNTYHMNAYDLGAGGQVLPFELYYLEEALKYTKPKTVFVEVGTIFKKLSEVEQDALVYTFAPTRPSKEKYETLVETLNNKKEAFIYTYMPILKFHSRWNAVEPIDIAYPLLPLFEYLSRLDKLQEISFVGDMRHELYERRGFLSQTRVEEVELEYYQEESESVLEIPDENEIAIKEMIEICNANEINLVFIKTPTSEWAKSASNEVKTLMNSLDQVFIDMHDYLDEMNINHNTDFYDKVHLNANGAKKATEWIVNYIQEMEK